MVVTQVQQAVIDGGPLEVPPSTNTTGTTATTGRLVTSLLVTGVPRPLASISSSSSTSSSPGPVTHVSSHPTVTVGVLVSSLPALADLVLLLQLSLDPQLLHLVHLRYALTQIFHKLGPENDS